MYKDKEVTLKKDELVVELERKGCANPKGNKEKIEELCRAFNIPLKKRIREIKHDWYNQPKGALQLLYERRFIDTSIPNSEKYYTMKGRKKRDGSIDLSTSLISLLNLLPDFQDKETMLMVYGKQTEHPYVILKWLEKVLNMCGLAVNSHSGRLH